ncbi:MAG: CDP-alcohol phosphatidyltransferase family protein [Anaerolineaceae bacterium]|nr:CDP-alcohol phosphatidyltransferase family protein [Anaerolineaceae bacterium]
MFDEKMRLVKDTTFHPLAQLLQSVPPWLFTTAGLLAGVAAAVALWQQHYGLGFFLWFINRLFDGLDGAVARMRGMQSDFGGYLDIVVDFVVYAAIPVGLAVGVARTAVATVSVQAVTLSLIFLLSTYYVNAASWMYLAAILEKRHAVHDGRLTTITMPVGLIGGTETIVFYTAFIFFPTYLAWLFSLMGLLLVVTIVQRLVWAARHLS